MTGDVKTKGTFTTSGSSITITTTHMWGTEAGLGAQWYTKARLLEALPTIVDAINVTFAPQTGTYSIRGDTLTLSQGVIHPLSTT